MCKLFNGKKVTTQPSLRKTQVELQVQSIVLEMERLDSLDMFPHRPLLNGWIKATKMLLNASINQIYFQSQNYLLSCAHP